MRRQFLIIFLSIILIAINHSAFGVVAYPFPVDIIQPDGSKITIIQKGDEHVKWAETVDGYSIMRNSKGIYEYAMPDSNNDMVPSGIHVRNQSERSASDIQFLNKTKKGLTYSKSQAGLMKSLSSMYAESPQKAFPTTGSRKLVCILMGFTDKAFTKTNADLSNLFNQIGYTTDGATGSVKDFYIENSFNQLNLTVTVAGPYTAANTMAYYGANDINGDDLRPRELVAEAVNLANPTVNYADFDNDGNGTVDGIYVIYAGYGEEYSGVSDDAIWAHAWGITPVTLDGKTISSYSCSCELRGNSGTGLTRIGVICHEFGHVMGASDFYDTDYTTNGQYNGTGYWDLMASGSWNNNGTTPAHHNPYTKIFDYGWTTATTLTSGANVVLTNAEENSNSFYRVNTLTSNEFYLIENRQQQKFDSYIPGHGMIIYHVDGNYISTAGNAINAGSHQGMYPVCATATGNPPTTYGTINSSGLPFPGTSSKASFTDITTPNSLSWAGANTNKPITSITENNTTKTVSFTICTTPTIQATNFTSGPILSYSMTVGWTRGNGNAVLVVARAGSAVNAGPVNGTPYTANVAFGSGTQIGTGNFVVYNGTGAAVTLTTLTTGTTYYYAIYEYTSSSNCYLTPALTGNAITQNCTAPIVGTITQPTCNTATGSVVLNNLPATGTWTLTRTPGGTTTTGTGTSSTITGLAANTYTYIVANSTGCTSAASANIVITTQPLTPTAPSSGTITQPTCTTATGGVVLSGLPATGTWSLTRTPGGTITTGTGTSLTITTLAANTYTYTVTNSAGCTSAPSANVVINTQPETPTAPIPGTITQPTCVTATGSVVLSGLPATGTWTLTRTPGGTTTTGTGISTTVSGIPSGLYKYTVTNGSGCTSVLSDYVFINLQPATLTTLTANTATNYSQTSFIANWTNPPTATGYKLDVATDIGFTTYVSGFNNKDVSNVTAFNVTGLSAITTYYYRVRAYNSCGTSSNSGTITATTLQNPPPAPTLNLPTNISQTGFNTDWSSSINTTGYQIDISTNNGFTSFVTGFDSIDVGNITSAVATGLSENTTYYYRVRAYNSGGLSINSGTITATTLPDPPPAPSANQALNILQTSFTASWNNSATTTGSKLDVATDTGFTTFVTGFENKDVSNVSTFNVTGLTAKSTYYYRVRGYNSGGFSGYSNTVTSTTLPDPPSAPTANPANNILTTSFSANWNSSAMATGYRLDVATNTGFTDFVTGFDNKDVSNVSTTRITGLSGNTQYYYRVKAYNTGGVSINSSIISTRTLPVPPPAPAINTATDIIQTSFSANWSSSTTATGYKLDVATNIGFTSFVTGFNDKDVSNVTKFNVTGLSPKTIYFYRVRAYNTGGTGVNSNLLTVTTLTSPPTAPTGLLASSCNDLVTLRWSKNSDPNFARYRIYSGTTNNPVTKTDSTTTSISDTSKIISGLTRGQTYYFRVSAVNYDGPESNFSSQSTAIVKTGVIPKINVKWDDVLVCYNLGDSINSFQWFNGSSAIAGATKQYYDFKKQPGSYKVEIIDKSGCKNSSNLKSLTGTKSLTVYPNPASVNFALTLNDVSEGSAVIRLINSSGVKVMEFQTENLNDNVLKEIPVNNLDEGIYVVQVLVNRKELYYTKIVVIK